MYPTVTDDAKIKAQSIAAAADAAYDRMRNRGELNSDAIRVGLARTYRQAKASMDALQAAATGDRTAQLRQATTAAWGIDDIAGTNSVDRAAASMSYRDAQDRAAQLDNARDALDALARATDTGDELSARAIAAHAYQQRWSDVVDTYTADRPRARQALATLATLESHKPNLGDLWAFVLPKPAELSNYSDGQLDALIAGTSIPAF
jgi:hypothetical protein